MIPKIIHGYWEEGEMNELARKCFASWRKFAPEFEIRIWTSRDFDGAEGGFSEWPFVKTCRARKLWGFLSDPVRYAALHEFGGVYLDLDVELVAPLGPLVAAGEFVAGEEGMRGETWNNPGSGIALAKGSPFAKRMLEYYAGHDWEGRTGGSIFGEVNGERIVEGKPVFSGLRVLDKDVMSPIGMNGKLMRTGRTVAIHHYAGSWFTPRQRFARWLSHHGFQRLLDLRLSLKERFR